MNKINLDMRSNDPDEYLVCLYSEVMVDGVRTGRAIRADESAGLVEEITTKDRHARITRYGNVQIILRPKAPEEVRAAYNRLRGL